MIFVKVKGLSILDYLLIGAEGARLLENELHIFSCVGVFEEVIQSPAGAAGQVRPHRSISDEEAHRQPRGKRSAWNGDQQPNLTQTQKISKQEGTKPTNLKGVKRRARMDERISLYP